LREAVKGVVKKIAKKISRKTVKPMNHAQLVAKFMSAKQGVPDRCTQDVYRNGKFLCILAGPRPWTIEAWVVAISDISGAKVDWNFMGGRAVVKYLGDDEKVFAAAEATKVAFEEAAAALVKLHECNKQNTEWCHPVQWMSVGWGVMPS
jgi:hypothetical protein